jgi:hypothetical protein
VTAAQALCLQSESRARPVVRMAGNLMAASQPHKPCAQPQNPGAHELTQQGLPLRQEARLLHQGLLQGLREFSCQKGTCWPCASLLTSATQPRVASGTSRSSRLTAKVAMKTDYSCLTAKEPAAAL